MLDAKTLGFDPGFRMTPRILCLEDVDTILKQFDLCVRTMIEHDHIHIILVENEIYINAHDIYLTLEHYDYEYSENNKTIEDAIDEIEDQTRGLPSHLASYWRSR